MDKVKKILNMIFIDGLSGMAFGLFGTLIIGTIFTQIAKTIPGSVGSCIYTVGKVASGLTGAGIACGVAIKLNADTLVAASSLIAGMTGAFASKILAGALLTEAEALLLSGPGEPLGAFVGAFVAIVFGGLISKKTKLDILLTPLVTIITGCLAGLFVGPPISSFMKWLGGIVNWGTEQAPILMGIVVSVIMGICLTLPISSAAIGVSLGLSGIAAGAAVVGCCCNMVGFAVASYRENKLGGLLAQGLGTSMIQMPNIVRHPQIWLPAIISSAICGPLATAVLDLRCNAVGAGMGTSGLIGPLMTYQEMASLRGSLVTILIILGMEFILPAVLSLVVSEGMRKLNMIKDGDMKLEA